MMYLGQRGVAASTPRDDPQFWLGAGSRGETVQFVVIPPSDEPEFAPSSAGTPDAADVKSRCRVPSSNELLAGLERAPVTLPPHRGISLRRSMINSAEPLKAGSSARRWIRSPRAHAYAPAGFADRNVASTLEPPQHDRSPGAPSRPASLRFAMHRYRLLVLAQTSARWYISLLVPATPAEKLPFSQCCWGIPGRRCAGVQPDQPASGYKRAARIVRDASWCSP